MKPPNNILHYYNILKLLSRNLLLIYFFFSSITFAKNQFDRKNKPNILKVIQLSPSFNEIANGLNPEIAVTFDVSMDSASFDEKSFSVLGERTGYHLGVIKYFDEIKTVTFKSFNNFNAGERVNVTLTDKIVSSQKDSLKGFNWQFRIPSKKVGLNFSGPAAYNGGGYGMQCIDMNNDSSPDIVTSSGIILINSGKGEFNSNWTLDDANVFYPIVIDDFNRDGYMDVFYAGNDGLILGFGNGKGKFIKSYYPWWFFGYISADINSDGYPDIIGFNTSLDYQTYDTTSYWGIALNDGTGHLNDTTLRGQLTGWFQGISSADVDNDGDLDIMVISQHAVIPGIILTGLEGLAIFRNNGNGIYDEYQLYPSCNDFPGFPKYIFTSDFNNDNLIDIAIAGNKGGIALNKGGGFYGECYDTTYIHSFAGGENGGAVNEGDVNGDGWIDIINSGDKFPPEMPNTYYEVEINCNSNFINCRSNNFFSDTLPDVNIFVNTSVDLDGDGDLDIVHSGTGVFVTLNQDTITSVTGIFQQPKEFRLYQNFPNPFNSSTKIDMEINRTSRLKLSIFNILGEEVKILEEKEIQIGSYSYYWDATNDQKLPLPSGIYFIQAKTSNYIEVIKSIILK